MVTEMSGAASGSAAFNNANEKDRAGRDAARAGAFAPAGQNCPAPGAKTGRAPGAKLSIGGVELESPFILAPLAGITDAPFRRLCRKQGAALVCSEMISAKGLKYGDRNTERLLVMYDDEQPVSIQLFGSEPDVMAEAARILAGRANAILDLNMGCPVPKVVRNGEGSALLRTPEKIAPIVSAMAEAAGKPVTVKMRIGWDDKSVNAVEAALEAEKGGAAAIAVHGRTREQFYSGRADRSAIRAVKEAVSVPVIANGDVASADDALSMLEETGCDFVMIGRGALGNPWIFREALAAWRGEPVPERPSAPEKIEMMRAHFSDVMAEKGEYAAVREMRKHVGWYMKGLPGAAEVRRRVNEIGTAEGLLAEFDRCAERCGG